MTLLLLLPNKAPPSLAITSSHSFKQHFRSTSTLLVFTHTRQSKGIPPRILALCQHRTPQSKFHRKHVPNHPRWQHHLTLLLPFNHTGSPKSTAPPPTCVPSHTCLPPQLQAQLKPYTGRAWMTRLLIKKQHRWSRTQKGHIRMGRRVRVPCLGITMVMLRVKPTHTVRQQACSSRSSRWRCCVLKMKCSLGRGEAARLSPRLLNSIQYKREGFAWPPAF
jgi:hypothetical protein